MQRGQASLGIAVDAQNLMAAQAQSLGERHRSGGLADTALEVCDGQDAGFGVLRPPRRRTIRPHPRTAFRQGELTPSPALIRGPRGQVALGQPIGDLPALHATQRGHLRGIESRRRLARRWRQHRAPDLRYKKGCTIRLIDDAAQGLWREMDDWRIHVSRPILCIVNGTMRVCTRMTSMYQNGLRTNSL